MTVESVSKTWSHTRSGDYSADGRSFRVSFSEGYQVSHTVATVESEILQHPDIPALRSVHPDAAVPCVARNVSKIGPVFSLVICDYEGETGPDGPQDSPENTPPEYVWSDTSTSEPVDKDWNGDLIKTPAGEKIAGVSMDIADQVLTVRRNFLLFSPWLTHQYRHSVNSDTFANYPAGTARLVGFSASNVISPSIAYWRVEAKIQFRYPYADATAAQAWYARVLNEGYHCKRDGVFDKCRDSNGEIATRPMLLTDTGEQVDFLADGTQDDTQANWLYFQLYNELPYSALGLI